MFISGDIFHKAQPEVKLLNEAIKQFREFGKDAVYAIPGNHDLYGHNYELLNHSGYYNLMVSNCIQDIAGTCTYQDNGFIYFGQIYGKPIQEPSKHLNKTNVVAIMHQYCYSEEYTAHAQRKNSDHVSLLHLDLLRKKYKVAFVGDNHQQFVSQTKQTTVVNCGAFINRRSDERHFEPKYYVLYDDLSVIKRKVDISKDLWEEEKEAKKLSADNSRYDELITLLGKARDVVDDFDKLVKRAKKEQSEDVQKAIEEIMNDPSIR